MPHFPGHFRDTFEAAIDAYRNWNDGEPEPTVEFEVRYQPRQIPISEACKLLWTCTDIIPSLWCEEIERTNLIDIVRGCTYGAVAQAMLRRIKQRTGQPHREHASN